VAMASSEPPVESAARTLGVEENVDPETQEYIMQQTVSWSSYSISYCRSAISCRGKAASLFLHADSVHLDPL
jgi:hypothetical protein